APGQLDPVEVGEHQVDDRGVGAARGRDVERLLRRARRERLEAGIAEDDAERPEDLLLVVDDEHTGAGFSGHVGIAGSCSGCCSTGTSVGSETTKLDPWPGSESTEIVPPLASMNPFAIDSPRPDPA